MMCWKWISIPRMFNRTVIASDPEDVDHDSECDLGMSCPLSMGRGHN
jgi:hypothetical protein